MGDLQGSTNVNDGLAMGDQLLSILELANDLLRCVAGSLNGGVPSPVWPDEDSHSPWTKLHEPRQDSLIRANFQNVLERLIAFIGSLFFIARL